MRAARPLLGLLLAAASLCSAGCMFVPRTQLNGALAQNRALMEQSRAQLAEIENLRIHSRNIENQLLRTEEQLALLEERLGLDGSQLADYRREQDRIARGVEGLLAGRTRLAPSVASQLADISQKYPGLRFDPATGIAKLDTDILFGSGEAELKPGAKDLVKNLVEVLNAPEASELKVMVVGHTDDRQIAGRPVRELYPNNFHLSSARALAVADLMRQAGLPEQRLAVAGMASHEPIAPNVSATDRQKNRRVEIFVMVPDVPVVGWTDSIPSVY
jgi:chemotaxis protein MotB